jgi:hypothetical protein
MGLEYYAKLMDCMVMYLNASYAIVEILITITLYVLE